MDFDISRINVDEALTLATTIESVLDKRTHKRNHLGDDIIVKGTLSRALNLPKIKKLLLKSNVNSQQEAIFQLCDIWRTLSPQTHIAVLKKIGLYEHKELNWDDPRSNRRAVIHSIVDSSNT